MTNATNNEVHHTLKQYFQIKNWLVIIAGVLVLETIGFIQFLLISEGLRSFIRISPLRYLIIDFPGYLLFEFFLFFFTYLMQPVHFWLVLEIPWISLLLVCHKKGINWSNERMVTLFTFVVGLAILPLVLVQLLGFPQIPILTDAVMNHLSQHPFSHYIDPVPYMLLYLAIFKWFISWGYMILLITQIRRNFVNKPYSKEILIVWSSWLASLTVFLVNLPVYVFTIPWWM